jgi:asparagine synthase (glutamine-hydrolysing)
VAWPNGFDAPVAGWLHGPLREWAEALLDELRLSREGLFNVVADAHVVG